MLFGENMEWNAAFLVTTQYSQKSDYVGEFYI
jgi:hypothetical protein